ncbi:hypothetical protein [Gramella sp. KN1008]|uniref:hypothetical protein n=1 Tax=Gramella sp. KN1008 TaxID=2529298 RepID=UPI001040A72A|nr:hypothetical protein [Gramella sp. KN1008]TBW28682.1 hypothetical protein EZJ28_08085 [Gramella sp. KN1008]
MKNIILLLFWLSFFVASGQETRRQLNQKINSLPATQKVKVQEYDNTEKKAEEVVNAGSFSLPENFTKLLIAKYDDQIKKVTEPEKEKMERKFNLNIAKNHLKIIPEYYVFSPNGANEELIVTPVIINSRPLTYYKDKGYEAELNFIMYSESGAENGQKIKNPIHLEIKSPILQPDPEQLSIEHVNLPSTRVKVFAKSANDSVELRIITNSNIPDGYPYFLKVTPVLQISANRSSMQGLGIQEIPVSVQFKGSGNSKKEDVIVKSSSGIIEPSSFKLAYNEIKTVKLRSEGLDSINIQASTSSSEVAIQDSNVIVIQQKFPFTFLIFSLIGGLIGALIRFGFQRSKEYPWKLFMAGILMGFLGAVLYYVLGINFFKMEMSNVFNEFAVLGFSALCSLLLKPSLIGARVIN